jgi:hypothetical protein
MVKQKIERCSLGDPKDELRTTESRRSSKFTPRLN